MSGQKLPRDAEELAIAGQIDRERETVVDGGEVGREQRPDAGEIMNCEFGVVNSEVAAH